MARKTNKLCKALIERHKEIIKHHTKVLEYKKTGDEAPWYKERSVEQIEAMVEGQNMMLEVALQEANCYHGYVYLAENMVDLAKANSPEFAEWRRMYLIKE